MNNNLEVHPSGGSSSTWFLVALEIGNVGFSGGDRVGGGTGVPRKKPLLEQGREPTTNSTHIIVLMLGLEPRPQVYPKMRRPDSL